MSSIRIPDPVPPAPRRARSRRPARIALRLCAWLALAASLAGKAGADDSAGLQVRDFTGEWRDLVALESSVDLRVRGMVNRGTVRQRYVNDTGEWLEGRYLLPLPGDAAVDTLRIRVGDRLIEGEVQEKAQARATYAAAAASGQVAALVEQRRDNLFSTAVANIGPGELVEVEIGWWQSARFEDGAFSLVLPLTFVPRYQTVVADPFAAMDAPAVVAAATPVAVDLETAWEPTIALSVDLDPGLPLASLTSPTHDIEVEPLATGYRVRLTGWVERADRDFELRWTPRPSASPTQVAFAESLDDGHYAMVMIVPPTLPVAPVPRELVLVVDNSGSMSGTSMQQATAAVDRALSRLRPDDRLAIRCALSAAGNRLAVATMEPGGAGQRIIILDAQTLGETGRFDIPGAIYAFDFVDAAGDVLAISLKLESESNVSFFESKTGRLIARGPVWRGEFAPTYLLATGDDQTVVCNDKSATVIRINADDGKTVTAYREAAANLISVAIDRTQGKLLICGGYETALFDLSSEKILGRFQTTDVVTSASLTAGGTVVVVGTNRHQLVGFDAATARPAWVLDTPLDPSFLSNPVFRVENGVVLMISMDGSIHAGQLPTN